VPDVKLERVSSLYKTEPVIDSPADSYNIEELKDQNRFINAVAEIRTGLPARSLLELLMRIEMQMGRVRTYTGAPRIIDLDLLLYGQEVIQEEGLIVPHPQMHKRRFVLDPICEIASYVIHPGFGVSMRGLRDRLGEGQEVEIYNS